MRFPVVAFDHLFHVGCMDPELKGKSHNRYSLEGDGLSVSVHPVSWRKIARLGDASTWRLSSENDKITLLDVLALSDEHWEEIIQWSVENGWITRTTGFKVSWETDELDEEGPGSHFMLFSDEASANDEAEVRDTQPESVMCNSPSEALIRRLQFKPDIALCTDMAMTVFVEEVLWRTEGIHGAWWQEVHDVHLLSAPRGVLHRAGLSELNRQDLSENEKTSSPRPC